MQIARWAGPLLLYATLVFSAFETIACQQASEPSNSLGDVYGPCKKYSEVPDAYGYCLYKFSGGFRSIKEIDMFCPQAGDWELECRHAWVSGRMHADSGFSTKILLQACGENPDCAFELVDFRPETDVLKQIDLCAKHVRKHIRDCVGHAMQRWWHTNPNAEEVSRILQQAAPVPDRVAYFAAASSQCSGIGSCKGEEYLQRLCEKNVRHFQRFPQACPPKSQTTMQHSFSPKELTPNKSLGQQKPKKPVTPPPQIHDGTTRPIPNNPSPQRK